MSIKWELQPQVYLSDFLHFQKIAGFVFSLFLYNTHVTLELDLIPRKEQEKIPP